MKLIAEYSILVILFALLFIRGIQPAWNEVHSDFANYFVSAKLVAEGESLNPLYDNVWFQQKIKDHAINTPGKFSPFPPLTAWLMLPLTFNSPMTAMRIWMMINLILLMVCVVLVRQLTAWSWVESGLILMATGQGLFNNIAFGQVYVFITAGWLAVLWLAKKKHQRLAGWVLGLLSWLKYFPAALLAGMILLRKNQIVIATAVSTLFLLFCQFWFFGFRVMNDFFQLAFLPHIDAQLAGQNMYSFYFQSWDGLLLNLFVFSAESNPEPFIAWALGKTIGKMIIYLFVSVSLVFAMKRILDLKLPEPISGPMLLALPVFAAFVVLPASATYHFVMLVVPMVLLLNCDFLNHGEKTGITIIYALIGFIPYGFCFTLATDGGLLFAYPRLALISILYAAILMAILRKGHPHIAVEKT
jgi:hypothetical protein